jgi:hypothetical protein
MVVDVSKVNNARLGWTWWEEDVEQRYGVVLDGWTAGDKPVDPSTLSTSLTVLRTLLEAIQTGACAFRKLGPLEAAERKAKWDADVAAGRKIAKHRAPRCDAGRARKRGRDEDEGQEEENDEHEASCTHASQANDPTSQTTRTPPKKRARKTHDAATAPTKPRTKTAGPAKSAAPKKSTMRKKGTLSTKKTGARDDPTTRAALEKLKSGSRSRVVSRPIINSDDEENDDPNAADGPTVSTSTLDASALVVNVPPMSVA